MVITLDTRKVTGFVRKLAATRPLKRARQALRPQPLAVSGNGANEELHEYVKDLTLIVDNLSTEVARLREQLNTKEAG